MVDLATQYNDQAMYGDLAMADGQLAQDDGLDTAILQSLFTDRRADDADALPYGNGDRRGWWGDLVPLVEGDQIGSKLWLLWREKQTPETLNRAREYAQEALAWLVADGHATRVEVGAEWTDRGRLELEIRVYLIEGSELVKHYLSQVGASNGV